MIRSQKVRHDLLYVLDINIVNVAAFFTRLELKHGSLWIIASIVMNALKKHRPFDFSTSLLGLTAHIHLKCSKPERT